MNGSLSSAINQATAETLEQRLQAAGIRLTFGGEPTYVPIHPEGAEWSVAADGPTKLGYAKALGRELERRVWPGSTLIYCPGKRYDGEVNPRWALRLFTGADGQPVVPWPQTSPDPTGEPSARRPLRAEEAPGLLAAIGTALGCPLHPLRLKDSLDPERQVWAAPLCHHEEASEGQTPGWQAALWPLEEPLRALIGAPGPAGLRLPLAHFPEGVLRQVLTLEVGPSDWNLFLPPLARQPLETLLGVIAQASAPWSQPELSGVLPLDIDGAWQVLGLTADPGVLEVNLPVCHSWADYADWMQALEEAGEAVGLRSWKQQGERIEGSGGGNHLLWGGPSLDDNPFFIRPDWLVGILRFWQHHPSLAYLFAGNSVGPASQAPRPDEGSAAWLDLELAHGVLESLPAGDQRVPISETLRHLHADKSGNTHRSEISLDKFWNPAWAAGCQGLIEFRALETFPHHTWASAVALLWRALAVHVLEPANRPAALKPFGETLHDQWLLPSQLWLDLNQVLDQLEQAGYPLERSVFQAIWDWRFPLLLRWSDPSNPAATLEIRRALEPWPLLCDTPVEGGSTSRFVDSSLRRFEVISSPAFRQHYQLLVAARPLALSTQPVAVRYRHEGLYPCLHPCIANHVPLNLTLLAQAGTGLAQAGTGLALAGTGGSEPMARIAQWTLNNEAQGFEPLEPMPSQPWHEAPDLAAKPWRGAWPGACTVDCRLS